MAIETVVEEVALNLEETAQAVRLLNGRTVSFGIGGLIIGAGAGLYFGYRYGKKKTLAEALAEADREIEDMRDFYRNALQDTVLDEQTANAIVSAPPGPKPSVESIVRERGYAPVDPASLSMDETVLPAHTEPVNEGRPLRPPVPIHIPTPAPTQEWNAALEQARRDVTQPYVISRAEWEEHPYPPMQYTYYDEDDVLVDDENLVVQDADSIVGEFNFRFGHGSDDETVVFVRNDRLQRDFEITKVAEAYEETVLGLDPHDES